MTTFQDPQPPSRRAARQSERSGTAEAEVGVFPAAAPADDMWDTPSRRAAQLPPATPVTPVVPPAPSSGRRSAAAEAAAPQPQALPPQTPAPQAEAPQPQVAQTPAQQAVPEPSAPQASAPQASEQFRRPRGAAPQTAAELPPTEALSTVDQPRYRVRDYSPPVDAAPAAPVAQPAPAQPSTEWTEPYTPDRSQGFDTTVAPTAEPALPPTLVQPVIPAAPVPAPVASAPAVAPVEEPVVEVPAVAVPIVATPIVEAPVAESPVAESPVVSEHTLTRREMRALQGQPGGAVSAPEAEPVSATAVPVEPIALQEPAAPETVSPGTPTGILSSLGFFDQTAGIPVVSDAAPEASVEAPAAFAEALNPVVETPAPATFEPEAPAPVVETPDASVPSAWPFALVEPTAPEEAPAAPVAAEPAVQSPLPAVAPEPIANGGLTAALAEFDELTSAPAEPTPAEPTLAAEPVLNAAPVNADPVAAEPIAAVQPAPQPVVESTESAPWTPPRGHWSTQLDQEDELVETTVNRTVGSGATATSSLLLPSIPEASISGPLNGSGEIMLTGSIGLPQSFSSTGASARLEHVGIDKLFESHDAEVVSTESAPVSAVNAISTQSGSGLGAAPKQQGTKALTALVIAAASMGLVVIGLLITALALNVFP